jgi:phytoene dehydrogenase-like protein
MTLPRTFLECMDKNDLDPVFVRKVRNFKIRGSSGKLNFALDGLPNFTALEGNPELIKGDLHLVDTVERLERAYDDWKNGIWSQDPYVDILIPSLTDPTMAPPGKHFMSVFVQYVPPRVKGENWTPDLRDRFGQTVINKIESYAPGFRDLIQHVEIRTPRDLEDEVGLNHPGGGVMAAPGANAAREILRDLRKPNTVPEGWIDD